MSDDTALDVLAEALLAELLSRRHLAGFPALPDAHALLAIVADHGWGPR